MAENNTTSCSSDMPAIVDKLGTEEQQRGLVEFMRHCSTPMTIAVQGDWGTGKTSMMQLLKNQLDDISGSTLWFPTWQFAVLGEQDRLLMDLLMLLCCKLEEKCTQMKEEDKKLFHKVFRFIKRVGRASAIGGLYLAAETGKTLTGIDCTNVLDKSIDTLEEQDEEENKSDNLNEINITYESYVMQVSKLHEDLTKLIDAYLEANGTKRLYIFIDDLDRLEPVRAVELLEGIKNFLDIPRCVFMLAIDTKVVMEGLKAKYGENMDEDKLVHFFDKIIQIPYKLPVHNYKLKAFMEDVLEGYDKENADKYVEFLESADIHNPRTIKRCVNFCLLHHCMDGEDAASQKDDNVKLHRFAVKMLELEYEELYKLLLAKIISLGKNFSEIREYLLDVKDELFDEMDKAENKYRFYNMILNHFKIDNKNGVEAVRIFAECIIYSAPSDFVLAEYIDDAQKIYDLVNYLIGKVHGYSFITQSLNTEKIIDITEMNVLEIAQILKMEKAIGCSYCNQQSLVERFTILIGYNYKGKERLIVTIKNSPSLNVFMCDTWRSQENIEKDEIIHHFVGPQVHEFSNIKDTSSPDAPIYKILQAAGVIEIPTELTPIAP